MQDPRVAVLVPGLDEESTVASVVAGFRTAFPEATVHVYDNGSSDATVERAAAAGALVRAESAPGKGSVVRRMFADVDADVCVMADGDGTYDPSDAPLLVKRLVEDDLDMVVGCRSGSVDRRGHAMGNRAFNRLYRWLFGSGFSDILSGYRAFSRRFVQSFPVVSTGFEIETEMSVHAPQLRLSVAEVAVAYGSRPEGSTSKLRTVADSWRILWSMMVLLKDNRPLTLFAGLATVSFFSSLALGVPIVADFARTGLVERLPTAVLVTGLAVVGLVLAAVAQGRIEARRLAYLQS